MRAAIRGDFERLAQRRGTQELMQEPSPEPEPEPEPELEPQPELEPAAREEEPPRRGFFARLLGL
jgi:fused signal recognition particle receptor